MINNAIDDACRLALRTCMHYHLMRKKHLMGVYRVPMPVLDMEDVIAHRLGSKEHREALWRITNYLILEWVAMQMYPFDGVSMLIQRSLFIDVAETIRQCALSGRS